MYQSEINGQVESLDQVPEDVAKRFAERRDDVKSRSVLAWSEHCTECAAPQCFATCDLYEPRFPDSQCRRFVDGMVRINHPASTLGYLLKIRFKRWGKLWSPASTRIFPTDEADRLERRDRFFGSVLRKVPISRLPVSEERKQRLMFNRYYRKKLFAGTPNSDGALPNIFLFECYNPNDQQIDATFTIETGEVTARKSFNRLMELAPGFNRVEIPVADIAERVDLRVDHEISITPNEIEDDTTLYFGITEFVYDASYAESAAPAKSAEAPKKVKCVVWDLDNTMWSGTLVEDGLENLELKPGIEEIIKTLDARGILHSVASKNDHDAAMAALKHFGLDDYFLCPQISWDPKGRAVKRIADILNIGADTLLFIDDQPFEREEVSVSAPDVQVIDAADYQTLTDRKNCQGSNTAEAGRRREMYREQLARMEVEAEYGDDDYLGFLKDCGITVEISEIGEENIDRVHELSQRTNQMNFSGTRYEKSELRRVMEDPNRDSFVLRCKDKFGDYGTVGFCIVEATEPRMLDLAFSCRVQNKRVEHAFIGYLMRRYLPNAETHFFVNYRKTDRNAPQGRVFDDMGFETLSEDDGVTTLGFAKGREIPEDGVIAIVAV